MDFYILLKIDHTLFNIFILKHNLSSNILDYLDQFINFQLYFQKSKLANSYYLNLVHNLILNS